MRKDFLQTDEEKQRRQQRLDENRSQTSHRTSTSSSSTSFPPSSSPNIDEVRLIISILFQSNFVSFSCYSI